MLPTSYYAGYHLNAATTCPPLPKFMEKAILDKAIKDHLAAVDRIQEVADQH